MELQGHSDNVFAVRVAANNQILASASDKGEIIIWDLDAGALLHREQNHGKEKAIASLDFSHDSLRVASCNADGIVTIWRWTGTRLELAMQHHDKHVQGVSALAFSSDSRLLASGGDKEIILWDTSQRKRVYTLEGHTDALRSLAFSSDNRRLLSASRDKSVKLWDVETGALLMTKKERTRASRPPRFSSTTRQLRPLASRAHSQYGPFRMTCTPSDGLFQLGQRRAPKKTVFGLVFSPDGKLLATADWGGAVYLWDLEAASQADAVKGIISIHSGFTRCAFRRTEILSSSLVATRLYASGM